jgi:hypothetical protein
VILDLVGVAMNLRIGFYKKDIINLMFTPRAITRGNIVDSSQKIKLVNRNLTLITTIIGTVVRTMFKTYVFSGNSKLVLELSLGRLLDTNNGILQFISELPGNS